MLCNEIFTNFNELKDHMTSSHLKKADSGSAKTEESKDEDKKKSLDEASDLISNMLGTKPDVIDHLLTSKSTADAAKLLGVR